MKQSPKYKILGSKLFLLVLVVAIGFVSINIGKEMYKAYQIEQEVEDMEDQVAQLRKERLELNENLAFLQTQSFKELEYRRRLNKIRPEEEVWVLQNVEDEIILDEGQSDDSNDETDDDMKTHLEETKDNWLLWWELFTGQS